MSSCNDFLVDRPCQITYICNNYKITQYWEIIETEVPANSLFYICPRSVLKIVPYIYTRNYTI